MAIDTKKAIQGVYDIQESYHLWVREEVEAWVVKYVDAGIDPNRSETFNQKHIDAIRNVLAELDDPSLSISVIRSEIENMLGEMELSVEEAEDNDEESEEKKEIDTQNPFDLEEFKLHLASEGWMTDDEWKEFGIMQGGVCVDEKIMTDIASRWDKERLAQFPDNSKFENTSNESPLGQEHYILTTSEWKLMMGRFFTSPSTTFSTDYETFYMWKLENGKNYVDWCKNSKLKKTE